MGNNRFNEADADIEETNTLQDTPEPNPGTKLDRRRRIEDIVEAKRMRDEMDDQFALNM